MAAAHYQIVVQDRLGPALLRWFDDLEIVPSTSETTCFQGWFPDQAALQGLLMRLGDLGLELVSVHRLPAPA